MSSASDSGRYRPESPPRRRVAELTGDREGGRRNSRTEPCWRRLDPSRGEPRSPWQAWGRRTSPFASGGKLRLTAAARSAPPNSPSAIIPIRMGSRIVHRRPIGHVASLSSRRTIIARAGKRNGRGGVSNGDRDPIAGGVEGEQRIAGGQNSAGANSFERARHDPRPSARHLGASTCLNVPPRASGQQPVWLCSSGNVCGRLGSRATRSGRSEIADECRKSAMPGSCGLATFSTCPRFPVCSSGSARRPSR